MPPLLTTLANASARALGFTMGSLSKIFDSFARVTSGSLGTMSAGPAWSAITGVWSANNGVATTASAPSSYPMASVVFRANATLTLQNVTPGSGILFWESGAGNWWGAVATANEVAVITSYSCTANTCCEGTNTCGYDPCCSSTPTSCSYYTYTGLTGSNCANAGGTVVSAQSGCDGSYGTCRLSTTNANAACCGTTCVPNSCCTGSNTCVYNSCCTYSTPVYTNFYNYVLELIKSVASTITVVATNTLAQLTVSGGVNGIKSLKVVTSGVNVIATGYSDGAMVTSLGTVTGSVGAQPSANNVGIMLVAVDSTASAIQGSTVGPITGQ